MYQEWTIYVQYKVIGVVNWQDCYRAKKILTYFVKAHKIKGSRHHKTFF